MKHRLFLFAAVLCSASTALVAQNSSSLAWIDAEALADGGHAAVSPVMGAGVSSPRPFSRVALGTGISPLGARIELTTNLMPHLNLRSTGNIFSYSASFTTNGIPATANLNMKSAGTSLDIYPFHKGFRVSPGVLFYNQNQLTADASIPGGTSFTLNNQTYYSAKANATTGATPISGTALLNMHATKPAPTITAGWGNTIPRTGHWSFPVEVGVAFIGQPQLNVNLQGYACYDQAQTLCTNISSKTDPIALQIQQNLQTQVSKWQKDIEPLKTYPIASFGVSYAFGTRRY